MHPPKLALLCLTLTVALLPRTRARMLTPPRIIHKRRVRPRQHRAPT